MLLMSHASNRAFSDTRILEATSDWKRKEETPRYEIFWSSLLKHFRETSFVLEEMVFEESHSRIAPGAEGYRPVCIFSVRTL